MNKQLQPMNDYVVCEVCHRTMLKGERAEPYLTPSRERRLVCELCAPRAQREGWIRESAEPEAPARPAREREFGGFLRRLRRRSVRTEMSEVLDAQLSGDPTSQGVPEPDRATARSSEERASLPRDPRHVRAVPTNAQLKVDRAIELFNASEHPRTIAGIARTLGSPRVSAATSNESPAEVVLTVAWELSWYQFAIDLSDVAEPVQLRGRGQEVEELSLEARAWNAQAAADGSLLVGAVEGEAGNSSGQQQDHP